MKFKAPILFLALSLFVVFLLPSCSDYGYADGYGEEGSDVVLDPNLYGTWSHGSGDDKLSWTFKSNGTAIEMIYNTDYDWKWAIEDGQLKLYVDNGIPAYKTYKIEGNKLYFWSDYVGGWSLPMTKE